jgi:hypothetical protein
MVIRPHLCTPRIALALSLLFTPALMAQGLDQGQSASVSANLSGYGGGSGAGYYGASPFFGTIPGTASVIRSNAGPFQGMNYSASGLAAAAPVGPTGAINLRSSSSFSVSLPTTPIPLSGSGAWTLPSISTAADRFTVPFVADGSTFVTLTLSGRISGTQSRVNDLAYSVAYLIGNPGLISQTSVWESRLDVGSGLADRTFNNVGFSFTTTIGVDPFGWMVGMQLITNVGWDGGGPGSATGAVSDFGSTVVVDSLTFRSGLTGNILAPGQFSLSTGSGLDYSPFIVPTPAASAMAILGLAVAGHRRRGR